MKGGDLVLETITQAYESVGIAAPWDVVCMSPAQKQSLMDELCVQVPALKTVASYHGLKVLTFESYAGGPMFLDARDPRVRLLLQGWASLDELMTGYQEVS